MNPDTKSKSKKPANASRPTPPPKQESVKPSKTLNISATRLQTNQTHDKEHRKIAVPARGHAKSRDHIEGQKEEDWLAVEAEIKQLLAHL